MRPSPPGFLQQLWLLWGLRLLAGLNRANGRRRYLAVLAYLASSAPALFLGVGFYRLLRLPPIAESEVWPPFLLNLLCFVTSSVWAAWPLLSAGVDDHSELSRYAAFPLSGFRLMLASMLASLFEPRALVFYAPLTGAVLGFTSVHPLASPPLAAALFGAYVLFNAALTRAGLHAMLNLLRQRRNAELLGGSLLAFLLLASFIPPIDTSWLWRLASGEGAAGLADQTLLDATLALGRVPPGFLGHGLLALSQGGLMAAVSDLFALLELTVLLVVVAYGLLLHFHRRADRTGAGALRTTWAPFARTHSRFGTLVVREALDLWHNPRARLLASVPFLLAILLKLLSGRELFLFLLGRTTDAWLMGAFCLYGAVVLGSTFSQNAFGYDGRGFAHFLAAPIDTGQVLAAKNLVHGTAALLLALAVSAFYPLYFRHGTALDWACALAGVACMIPVLLAAGNFLSLVFPVKFHASLQRRDQLPLVASLLGVAAASLGGAPFAWVMKHQRAEGPTVTSLLQLLAASAAAWLVYAALLPAARALLVRRREAVLLAVTRERT